MRSEATKSSTFIILSRFAHSSARSALASIAHLLLQHRLRGKITEGGLCVGSPVLDHVMDSTPVGASGLANVGVSAAVRDVNDCVIFKGVLTILISGAIAVPAKYTGCPLSPGRLAAK